MHLGNKTSHNSLTELKYSIGPGKMTQQERVFATKPDSLSFILKIYITEGEKKDPITLSSDLGLCAMICTHTINKQM